MANERKGIATEIIEDLERIGTAAGIAATECAAMIANMGANMGAERKDEEI